MGQRRCSGILLLCIAGLLGACSSTPTSAPRPLASESATVTAATPTSAPQLPTSGVSSTSAKSNTVVGTTAANVVEFHAAQDKWFSAMVDCLRAAGQPVQTTGGGFTLGGDSNAGYLAWNRAVQACQDRLGPQPVSPPYNAAEAAHAWDLQMAAYQCLKAHGFPVEQPPSKRTWIAQAQTATPPNWTAYLGLSESGSGGSLAEAEKLCPQPMF